MNHCRKMMQIRWKEGAMLALNCTNVNLGILWIIINKLSQIVIISKDSYWSGSTHARFIGILKIIAQWNYKL